MFKQLEGSYGWGVRSSRTDSRFTPHTNIVIRNNYLSPDQHPVRLQHHLRHGRAARADRAQRHQGRGHQRHRGLQLRRRAHPVQRDVRHRAKAGGADSNGIDADRATTATIVQYNYVHDNGDGILICQFAFGDSIVRYNVLVNNSRHGINLHSDSGSTNQTYNNLVFYEGSGSANLIATSGDAATYLASPYTIRNNILHSTRAAAMVVPASAPRTRTTCSPASPPSAAPRAVGRPCSSTARPTRAAAPRAPRCRGWPASRCAPARPPSTRASRSPNNGGVDFWGDPLYNGTPDIGPFEAP